MSRPSDLIQGTLDLLILRTLSLEPKHGWAIAKRIQQSSGEVLQVPREPSIPRSVGWSSRVGSAPIGGRAKPGAKPSSIRSRVPVALNWRKSWHNGSAFRAQSAR
jgi:hypothetical protein